MVAKAPFTGLKSLPLGTAGRRLGLRKGRNLFLDSAGNRLPDAGKELYDAGSHQPVHHPHTVPADAEDPGARHHRKMTGQIGSPTADSIDDVGHAQFVFSERLDNGQTEGMRDGPKYVCL